MKTIIVFMLSLATITAMQAAADAAAPTSLPADAPTKSAPPTSQRGITGLEEAPRRADGAQVVEGTLAGQGVITDQGKRVIKGKVSPGNSPGCVTDQGHVIFEGSGWLEIELGGATACTGYDQYSVDLSLTLNAPTLNVSLYGGFVPEAGQRFDILNWGSLSGTFATLNLPTLTTGLNWDVSQLYTTGELVVHGPPTTQQVPVPNWALGLLGAGLVGVMKRYPTSR
jgi:hypothetical protein